MFQAYRQILINEIGQGKGKFFLYQKIVILIIFENLIFAECEFLPFKALNFTPRKTQKKG